MLTNIKLNFFSIVVGLLLAAYGSIAHAGYDAGRDAYDNRDYATALKELGPLAKQGDARAQRILGQMYRRGRGVVADIVKGTTWIHKAASQDWAPAQYDLGVIFLNMAVTRGQYAKAVKWLTAASLQGHLEAQFRLGKMYRDGYGVEVDDVKALVLFNSAGKKIKDVRGAMEQLLKRMSKKDISRAKNMKMAVFKSPAKIKTFAESKKTVKDVKGKCGIAGKSVYLTSGKLEKIAVKLRNCVGKEWSGNLCSAQLNDLKKTYEQLDNAAKTMAKHC